ncbi:ChrR family anti-sigma-E factor [Primorskyibacter sp. S187A]|uniref:ChrR family anti-sigma-E factor n=1 Tax=Primorskyibacter sp. S187A TaxID=3415130 RepID=UPI003C7DD483
MTETIKHHPTDALLMAYAAGSLPEAFSLAVATHVSMCDTCRAQVHSYEAVGGNVLEDAGAVELSPNSFADTLALINSDILSEPEPMAPAADTQKEVPLPLHDYISGSLADVKWKPVGMGVKQALLDTGGEGTARLLFIPAGTAVPDHGHRGTELTLVLKGAFRDEEDYFGPGDMEVATEDHHHTPVADISEDCICLAVTDAPLKFSGLIPRLAQPFLRI